MQAAMQGGPAPASSSAALVGAHARIILDAEAALGRGTDAVAPLADAQPPLVSVVLPTHRSGPLLERAIVSVLMQTHTNWELLVVLDSRVEGMAAEVGRLLQTLDDPRIRLLVNEVWRGGGYSRSRGAEASRGSYIAFLDSDDFWLPCKLAAQLQLMHGAGDGDRLVAGGMGVWDGHRFDPVSLPPYRTGQPLAEFIYAAPGAVLQTSSILVTGDLGRRVRFHPDLRVNQDTEYLLRLQRAGARFLCASRITYVSDNSWRGDRVSHDPENLKRAREWFLRESVNWSERARRGFALVDSCMRCAQTGRRGLAFLYWLQSLRSGYPPGVLVRHLLRIVGHGDVPPPLKRLYRRLRPGSARSRAPGSAPAA